MTRLITTIQRCQVCGCTEDNPCCYTEPSLILGEIEELETLCHWVAPNLCSNPDCVQTVADQFGNAVLIG